MIWAWIELTFLVVAAVGNFLNLCWKQYWYNRDVCLTSEFVKSRPFLALHKKLGGNIARKADHNWPKGIPNPMVSCSIVTLRERLGRPYVPAAIQVVTDQFYYGWLPRILDTFISAGPFASGSCRFLLEGIPVLHTGQEFLLKIEDFCIFLISLSVVLSLARDPSCWASFFKSWLIAVSLGYCT